MHAPSSELDTRDAWHRVVKGLVRHRADTAQHLAHLLGREPDHVAALCLRGFALLFKGRVALRREAATWAETARRALEEGAGEPDDRMLVDALLAWAADDAWAAEAALRERLTRRPHELFTVKLQHGLLFMMGQPAALRDRIEGHLATWPAGDPDIGYVLGAAVFARVECGDLDGADVLRRRWAEHPADDAWGLHAVAHLLHERGRYGEALDWLEARRGRWRDCDRFGNHLDWHRALLRLRLDDPDGALALYDAHLRRVFDGDYRDMSNAVSILWRLHAHGIDVGARWRELAAAREPFLDDHGSAFADAHYALAQLHGGAEGAADRLVASLESQTADGYQARVIREVGHPLCRALASWRRCPSDALATLRRLEPALFSIGGSHAQRSLFEDVRAHLERTLEGEASTQGS